MLVYNRLYSFSLLVSNTNMFERLQFFKCILYTLHVLCSLSDPCDSITCNLEEGYECQIYESTGELYCAPNCDLDPCGPGEVCRIDPVQCIRAPCPGVLTCVSSNDGYYNGYIVVCCLYGQWFSCIALPNFLPLLLLIAPIHHGIFSGWPELMDVLHILQSLWCP